MNKATAVMKSGVLHYFFVDNPQPGPHCKLVDESECGLRYMCGFINI